MKILQVIKLIIFSTTLVLVLLSLNKLFTGKSWMVRTSDIYHLDEDVELLIIGSSHVYNTFDTGLLDKKLGINSYLLATAGQGIGESYYLLKEFLAQNNTPKILVIEGYSFNSVMGSNFNAHAAFDGMRISINKLEAIQQIHQINNESKKKKWMEDIFFDENQLMCYTEFLFPIYKYHPKWKGELTNADFENDEFKMMNNGYIPLNGILKDTLDLHFNYSIKNLNYSSPLDIKKLDYFLKINEVCLANNIKLVVASTPYLSHQGFSPESQTKKLNYLKSVVGNEQIELVNYNALYSMFNYADFKNVSHLNAGGARKLSNHFAKWLKMKYPKLFQNHQPNSSKL